MQVAAINQINNQKDNGKKQKTGSDYHIEIWLYPNHILGFVKEYPIYKVIRQPLKQQENDHTSDESAQ